MMGAVIFPCHTHAGVTCPTLIRMTTDGITGDLRHYSYPHPTHPAIPARTYLSKREHHKSDAGCSVQKSSVCWVLCTEIKYMLGALYRNQMYAGCSVQKSSVCWVLCTEIKCMLGALYRNQVYAGCSVQKSSVCSVLCTEIKCMLGALYRNQV